MRRSKYVLSLIISVIQPLKMDLTEGSETSAKLNDTGEIPKRKHTSFRTRRKSEIKNAIIYLVTHPNYFSTCDLRNTPQLRLRTFAIQRLDAIGALEYV
jgi:hypothetical protein